MRIFVGNLFAKGSTFFFEIALAAGTSTKMELTGQEEALGDLDNGFQANSEMENPLAL